MSVVSTDRWSCPHPGCGHVEALQVVTTEPRARARLQRVQEDHGRVHADQERRSTLRSMVNAERCTPDHHVIPHRGCVLR